MPCFSQNKAAGTDVTAVHFPRQNLLNAVDIFFLGLQGRSKTAQHRLPLAKDILALPMDRALGHKLLKRALPGIEHLSGDAKRQFGDVNISLNLATKQTCGVALSEQTLAATLAALLGAEQPSINVDLVRQLVACRWLRVDQGDAKEIRV